MIFFGAVYQTKQALDADDQADSKTSAEAFSWGFSPPKGVQLHQEWASVKLSPSPPLTRQTRNPMQG